MKILVHSNAPNVKTGYGVQCAQLVELLHDAGHDVAVSATYGQQGHTTRWRPEHPRRPELWGEGIPVYQCGWEQQGNDIIHNHALHHFGGDPLGGWIIPLLDVWALINPLLDDFNVAAWAPVDHFPAPPGVLRFFERNPDAVPVAMSRFGAQQFTDAGLEPVYVPLTVDTRVYKPTPTLQHPAHGTIPGRVLIGVPDEAFLVGMVAMNKDAGDRKGFGEAFAAFGAFWRQHTDAVLYVHADKNGMGTSFNLEELARHCGIPPHAIVFPDVYAYQMGFTAEMMAAVYTACDVLLSPSHGEGFCVPLIEAQACGTPAIVTDFSAQPELLGAGWKVMGQQQWDPAQHAFYIVPYIVEIVAALTAAWQADLDEMSGPATEFAGRYDCETVFDTHWRPLLDQLGADPEPLDLQRDEPFKVDVIVPLMRWENLPRLIESFGATNDGTASLVVIQDPIKQAPIFNPHPDDEHLLPDRFIDTGSADRTTYAEKVNLGFAETTGPWALLVGDDVEFRPGWIEEARKLADRFDVIGTNDALPGTIRNPEVATGRHADHFFVRRSYVEKYGASLDGPGVLAPEAYKHWFVDKEIIGLARARGVFAPCLSSIVEHHHPGYEGRPRDAVYVKAIEHSARDQETYAERLPLIEMQRTTRGKAA